MRWFIRQVKTMQSKLSDGKVNYSLGTYNKYDDKEQWIRITEGCPHNCPFCYEPQEQKVFDIPEIVRNDVKIMDMNLLCKPQAMQILDELGKKRVNGKVVYYDLVCGVDYRFLNHALVLALHVARIKKIRLAWDWGMREQYKLKDAIKMLSDYYPASKIMVFMICNWKISFDECCQKLDLLKVWGAQVSDCYFDNQTMPDVVPEHWSKQQIKEFRRKCRKHNQLINFGIDPEVSDMIDCTTRGMRCEDEIR